MITVYGLVYYALEYAEQSIRSIRDTAGEGIEINVIDAKSDRSDLIESWGREAVKKGLITRFIQADTNCKGAGPVWSYKSFPPREDIFVITDLDVLAKPGWLQELRKGLATKEVAGFHLEMDNYVSPNIGFSDKGFGTWLMGISTNLYNRYLEIHDHHQDSVLLQLAKDDFYKSEINLTHLGWDIWKDYPEYWKEKLEPIDWMASEPAQYTVWERG